MTDSAREALLRAQALQRVLAACADGRCPADPALIVSLERVAGRCALWASVAHEHGEAVA
ncbi:MAG TPA: hypothetical protein VNF71_07065 [Acidimicrobiales bacterium]|nr:hypothetical protein [Acidimicrobiales bacterium]